MSACTSGSSAVALTGMGRVCGASASSAPSVMTDRTPRSAAMSSSSAQYRRQRIDGSMPCTSTTSRPDCGTVATATGSSAR